MSVQRLAAELEHFGKTGDAHPFFTIETILQGSQDLSSGHMTPEAYTATEQNAEAFIRTLLNDADLRVRSNNHGFQFGLDCLRIVQDALVQQRGEAVVSRSLERARQGILVAIGKLALASDWYHETNPTQSDK